MNAILEFFQGFIDIVVSAVNFVVSLVEDLIYVIGLLTKFVVEIPSFFSWLPASVLALIVTIFGIVVVMRVVGRSE